MGALVPSGGGGVIWVRGETKAESPMKSPCPDCGADVELADQAVRLRRGTCGGCGHPLFLISGEEAPLPEGPSPPAEKGGPEEGRGAAEGVVVESGPPCPQCGGMLELRAQGPGRLTMACSDCDSEFTYLLQTEGGEGEARRPRRERGPREPEGGPARTRPCRKCGEPLRFSTNPDGTVTGSCEACGNQFTLPPRREGQWGGRPRARFGGRPGRGPPRGRPWSSGPPRPRRFSPRRSEGFGSEEQERRPRRRRDRRDAESD